MANLNMWRTRESRTAKSPTERPLKPKANFKRPPARPTSQDLTHRTRPPSSTLSTSTALGLITRCLLKSIARCRPLLVATPSPAQPTTSPSTTTSKGRFHQEHLQSPHRSQRNPNSPQNRLYPGRMPKSPHLLHPRLLLTRPAHSSSSVLACLARSVSSFTINSFSAVSFRVVVPCGLSLSESFAFVLQGADVTVYPFHLGHMLESRYYSRPRSLESTSLFYRILSPRWDRHASCSFAFSVYAPVSRC